MSNSLIVLLAILVWIPFTLYYFRKELSSGGKKKGVEGVAPSGEINIEDCLGASKQSAVAKAVKPSPTPAMPAEPATKPTPPPAEPMPEPREDVKPEAVSSVPPSFPMPEEDREELPFYMAAEPGNMEVVGADEEDPDEWVFEQQDMHQSLREEEQLRAVEHDLREPFRSEEEDRRIAEELHALQPYEVFNTLREDARLRTQEILSKYPPIPPEPLPEEEEPLDEEDNTGMEGEEREGMSENGADEVNDFLNS